MSVKREIFLKQVCVWYVADFQIIVDFTQSDSYSTLIGLPKVMKQYISC